MLGPIDYVVIGFRGNNFDGSIMDELSKAVEKGTIRVIDLLFIMKDKDGNVSGGEYQDQPDELKKAMETIGVDGEMPLLTEQDMDKIAADLENETAAGVLVIEHLWAKDLKKAIIAADGFLIADGRLHPELVAEAVKELEAAEA